MDDAYRVLGVPPEATEEQIRQAYLDLVRVWHPDRFQSDPRLRRIAEDRLRQINKAYEALKQRGRNGAPPGAEAAAAPRSGAPPLNPRRPQTWTAAARAFASALRRRPLPRFTAARMLCGVTIAAGCAIPVVAALWILPLLRVPVLDLDLIDGRARLLRPRILAPARIIDPAGGVRLAADTLMEWARGEAIDLWRPLSATAPGAPKSITRTLPFEPPPAVRYARTRKHPARGSVIPNGTEFFPRAQPGGAGEVRLVNNTSLEEIAILWRRKLALRAIYIAPGHEALLRSIGPGFYRLHLELGRDLDVPRLRFQNERFAPDPVGPFEFIEVTSAEGTTGQLYEIAVNPACRAPSRTVE